MKYLLCFWHNSAPGTRVWPRVFFFRFIFCLFCEKVRAILILYHHCCETIQHPLSLCLSPPLCVSVSLSSPTLHSCTHPNSNFMVPARQPFIRQCIGHQCVCLATGTENLWSYGISVSTVVPREGWRGNGGAFIRKELTCATCVHTEVHIIIVFFFCFMPPTHTY